MITMAVRLAGKRCIVIGGGPVATRRIGLFLAEQAKVTVVSPSVTPEISTWAAEGQLTWLSDVYSDTMDLQADFVLVATSDSVLNEAVANRARAMGALVNRADNRDDCDFTFPASVTVGDLQFAIFTGRVSPRLSRLIKADLAKRYEPVAQMLPVLKRLRREVRQLLPTPAEREAFWQAQLGEEQLAMIIDGEWKRVEEILNNAISSIRLKP